MVPTTRQQATTTALLLLPLIFLLLSAPCCSALASGPETPLGQFRTCVNTRFTFQATSWHYAVTQNVPPRLFIEQVWESKKPLSGPLTIVTHTSYNRLFQLRAQCKSWGGPLVASVHVALYQPEGGTALNHNNAVLVQDATRQLQQFFHRMESMPRCQLSMMLVWEVYSEPAAIMLYPYNMLRNYAMLLSRTELVSMIDVDLLPSQNLFPELSTQAGLLDNLHMVGNKTAVVLPAFETAPSYYGFMAEMTVANRAIHGGKATIIGLVGQGLVRPFHILHYPQGHNCTDYTQWYSAQFAYPITPTDEYEPWFILRRRSTLWYDIRYRGYFYDKIIYVAGLKYLGFNYVAHPRAYVIHRPHARAQVLQTSLVPQLQAAMHGKYMADVEDMKAGKYLPVVDSAFLECAGHLPWFQDFPKHQRRAD